MKMLEVIFRAFSSFWAKQVKQVPPRRLPEFVLTPAAEPCDNPRRASRRLLVESREAGVRLCIRRDSQSPSHFVDQVVMIAKAASRNSVVALSVREHRPPVVHVGEGTQRRVVVPSGLNFQAADFKVLIFHIFGWLEENDILEVVSSAFKSLARVKVFPFLHVRKAKREATFVAFVLALGYAVKRNSFVKATFPAPFREKLLNFFAFCFVVHERTVPHSAVVVNNYFQVFL